MSTNLALVAKKAELLLASIAKSETEDMREGDVYIDNEGTYHKILTLKLEPQEDHDATREKYKAKHGKELEWKEHDKLKKKDRVFIDDVRAEYISNYAGTLEDDDDVWTERPHSFLIHKDKKTSKAWVKVTEKEKYARLAADVIESKVPLPDVSEELGPEASTGALVHTSSKEYLALMQQGAKERMQHFQVVHHMVRRDLEKKKHSLNAILGHFNGVVEAFQAKVRRIQKIIDTIELYLGIHETILQFQEGPKAPVEEPITFRQKVMFMDEEVGDPRLDKWGNNEGLDFRNIDAFDSWLCSNENYKKIMPEQKCVCIFKVRRKEKEGHWQASGGNPFLAGLLTDKDKKTYILIRNGDNLYRIWTNLEIYDRLFPHKNELLELQRNIDKIPENWYGSRPTKKDFDRAVEFYQRQFIMMQGLIDRTDILHPLKEHIKLMDLDLDKTTAVRFVYDDGLLLAPPGHIPYKEWVTKINATIEEGSRIVVVGYGDREYKRYDNRFGYKSENLPASPHKGVYTVEMKRNSKGIHTPWVGYQEEPPKEAMCIYYNPGDEINNWWDRDFIPHERKHNISYLINPKRDKFYLNFDAVTTKDIDYYLDSRLDRREYLKMMPMLWEVRKQKQKEEEEEHDFLLMVIAPFSGKATQEVLLDAAREDMLWWKLKNKWKRGLKKDDAKAFRMIGARLKTRFK